MKKILAFLLVLVLIFSSHAYADNIDNNIWHTQQTVDEFGDVTEDSITILETFFSGSFSNTATSGDDLCGVLRFCKKPDSNHYLAQIVLMEYNNSPALCNSWDSLSMKIKVDDTIIDLRPTITEPNGGLYLGAERYDYSGDFLFNQLYSGNDLRCIVNIGNSKYNFNVPCGNFAELCDSLEFPVAPGQMTAKEAVEIFVTDNGSYMANAANFFTYNTEAFEVANSAELEDTLHGNFFEISIDTFAPYWTIKNYDNSKRTQVAYLMYQTYGRSYENTENKVEREYSTENDLLTIIFHTGKREYFQVRKLTDDIYITYEPDNNGSYTKPDELMLRYNDEVTSSYSIYNDMLPSILENLIPQITN